MIFASNRRVLRPAVLAVLVFFLWTAFPGAHHSLEASPKKKKKIEDLQAPQKLYLTTGLMIRKAVDVAASADDVFKAWTTSEGAVTFFAPKASVELAVGGAYEMVFDRKQKKGLRGSEGCKILSFVPGEFLSFTWNAPPSMPTVRKVHTWLVLHFQPLSPQKTRVSMIHLGWQAGEEWQKALKYFDRAWEVVLGRLQYRFSKGPINWKHPFTPPAGTK